MDELVGITEVNRRVIYEYRRLGLIDPPERKGNNPYVWSRDHIAQIEAIQQKKSDVRTLEDIRDALPPPPMLSPSDAKYTIHDLADRTGLTPRVIHKYRSMDLIPPPVKVGGRNRHVVWTEVHVQRLLAIKQMKADNPILRRMARQNGA